MNLTLRSMALLVILLACLILPTDAAEAFADPAFKSVWDRTDAAVAAGRSPRSWLWGPAPTSTGLSEAYQQSPNGRRLVQYFDKARMEINNPTANKTELWYITNGLLPVELMTGKLQIGDDQFEHRTPANIPAVGDPDNTFPTYADLGHIFAREGNSDQVGHPATRFFNTDGTISSYEEYRNDPATHAALVEHKHGIPAAFLTFMTEQSGALGRLFVFGSPVSAAYWVKVRVGGVERPVLVQIFERRVLTFTPDNPEAFRVESGNVGQHYYTWRYGTFPQDFSQYRAAYHRSGPIPSGGAANVFVYKQGSDAIYGSPAIDHVHNTAVFGTFFNGVVALSLSDLPSDTSVKWTYRGTGQSAYFRDSPLLYRGGVYIADSTGRIHAIDLADGTLRWLSAATGAESSGGPPITDGTYLYLTTSTYPLRGTPTNGTLHAIRLVDGVEVWQRTHAAAITGGPIFVGDTIHVATQDGRITAYTRTGTAVPNWPTPNLGAPITATPAVADGVMYVPTAGGKLFALRTSGEVILSVDLEGEIYTTPAVAGGMVYVGTTEGTLYGVSASNVQDIRLTFHAGSAILSSPAVVDNYVYFSANNNNVYQIEAGSTAKGRVLLTASETSGFGTSSPVVVDGRVYIGKNDGTFYIIK